MNTRQFLLPLLALALLLPACCAKQDCECVGTLVKLRYLQNGTDCQDLSQTDFQVAEYDLDWQLRESEVAIQREECLLEIPVSIPQCYWIVSAPSLGIRDTVRLMQQLLIDNGPKCCDCPPEAVETSLRINGQPSTKPSEFEIAYQ